MMKPKRVTNTKKFAKLWFDHFHNKPYDYAAQRTFRAFRYTKADGSSYNFTGSLPKLITKKWRRLMVPKPDCNPHVDCGAGVNVGTLRYCLESMSSGYKLWEVEFTIWDVAVIPFRSGGKFRLHRCTVIREVPVTPVKTKYGSVIRFKTVKPPKPKKAKVTPKRKKRV